MDFNKVIKLRASIRKFSGKPKIDEIIQCIEAANLAPSPGSLQILKYIIIEEPKTIREIAEACQQEFIEDAGFVVVLCSNSSNVKKMFDEPEKYTKQHAGAAIENFLLKIADLGLASCWIGAFSDATLRRMLKIPENIEIEALFPIGYGKGKQEKKPILDSRIFFEKWNNRFKKSIRRIRREDV